jgi:hypothetical protein
MTDLDHRLRALSEAMVGGAPDPPRLEEITAVELEPVSPRPRRSRLVVLLVTILVVAAIAGTAVWLLGRGTSTHTKPASVSARDGCIDSPGYFTNETGQTFGPSVPPGFNGTVTSEMLRQAPDFTEFGCRDGSGRIAGWIPKEEMLAAQENHDLESLVYTVYDSDATTVLGHWYLLGPAGAPCGYVRIGEDPSAATCTDEGVVTIPGPGLVDHARDAIQNTNEPS